MPEPPPTPVEEVRELLHGVEVVDPYRWLEAAADPRVREWTAAQGAYTRALLDALPGRAAVERRLAEAFACGALGGVAPRGERCFFTRRTAGMEQAALYVREAGGAERTLVDPGPLSADGTTALDWWYPSPEGELVCVGLSEAGSEDSTLRLLRTAGGAWLEDAIPRCRWAAVAFEPELKALLYSRGPAPGTVPAGEELYHRHLYRHVLGDDPDSDAELFGAGRDRTDVPESVSLSPDGRWMVLVIAQGWERTAAFLRYGEGEFKPFFEGLPSLLHAWFAGERLLGVTNHLAPNYRLVEIDPRRPEPEAWHDLVPESGHVLVGAAAASGRLAVHHLVEACSRVALHLPDGTFERSLELPPLSTVTGLGAHPSSADVYVTVEGFTRPATTHRYAAANAGPAAAEPVARLEPPPGFRPERHPVRQVHFHSRDGTELPMFLAGRPDGPGATVLTGYGGFNLSRTPLWTAAAVPFWEAGGLLAVANLRGGGEFGESWHRAGRLGLKQNVFDDFAAAAEWLIAQGLATPRTLGILGGSNGGLLVGAAMTQRPELFGCVVCRVPLLDMVRYEEFKVARLWAAEYGSAADPEQFRWLLSYSPYHHVRDGVSYPPALITTGEEDSRVDPMHARKMAARLQAADPSGKALLRVEPRAGHGQGKPVSKLAAEETDVWAFLLDALSPP